MQPHLRMTVERRSPDQCKAKKVMDQADSSFLLYLDCSRFVMARGASRYLALNPYDFPTQENCHYCDTVPSVDGSNSSAKKTSFNAFIHTRYYDSSKYVNGIALSPLGKPKDGIHMGFYLVYVAAVRSMCILRETKETVRICC